MILLTVGKQLPFDRLVSALDTLTPGFAQPVVAQVGQSAIQPRNIETHAQLSVQDFEDLAARARLIVAHAGIGSILLASRLKKPIVLMPRRADLGEHRNDHQIATAKQFEGGEGIFVAWDEKGLALAIEHALHSPPIGERKSPSLEKLRKATESFIVMGDLP